MKTLGQYILMVGIPLLCMFGILWAGADLQAPQSVGGVWAISIASPSDQSCEGDHAWQGEPQLVISQSGSALTLQFNNSGLAYLDGRLDGLAITAQGGAAPGSPGAIRFQATVDPESAPDKMTGVLISSQCPAPLALTGLLQGMPQTARESH
jgi:hypothetical protein